MKRTDFPHWRLLLAVTLLWALSAGGWSLPSAHAQEAGITSPAPGGSVSGTVTLMGTANIDGFQRYELYFKQEPGGDESYIYFGGATNPVFNGQLGVWQTADLAPGTYTLRMRVVRQDGNYSEHFAPNLSVNLAPPTPTPTPTPDEPTPTPIPIDTPTPVPQPTPMVVQVEQPDLGDAPAPEPEGEPTPELLALGGNQGQSGGAAPGEPSGIAAGGAASVPAQPATGFTAELGAALALDRLRDYFMTGVMYSGGAFLILFLLFSGKRLLSWILTKNG